MAVRASLTPIGADLESIVIAVALFLACGLLMFLCCFVVTQIYVCYKQARSKSTRHTRQENEEFQFAVMQADLNFDSQSV